MVIIDQNIGYIGGIDLCWGRYDTYEHKINESANPEEIYMFPGLDYSNMRIKDFESLGNFQQESISRDLCRMPWHDIHCFLEGPCVSDLCRHFIERWNYARTIGTYGKTHTITEVKNSQKIGTRKSLVDSAKSLSNSELGILSSSSRERDHYECSKDGGRSLMEKRETIYEKFKGVFDKVKNTLKQSSKNMTLLNQKQIELIDINIRPTFITDQKNMVCQILRSASDWSNGLIKSYESSIKKAYYDLIENSKHYIYIENQFFISKSFTDDEAIPGEISEIENEIALYIRKRIEKAFNLKEKFRVFIFIPLLPGFPGEVNESTTLQILLKYTYKTISRNKGLSLLEKLFTLIGTKFREYISFFSLRNHCEVNGIPKTEIIYIHSKLMIVDDETVLMGSANLNDRSLLGSRDSEIAVKITDQSKIKSVMNQKEYLASNYAYSLRIRLMKEHLGFEMNENNTPEILIDPLNDRLYNLMRNHASDNTFYYREIFNCIPDDKFLKFSDLELTRNISWTNNVQEENERKMLVERYKINSNQIKGHIVEFPLNFLKNENFNISYFAKENLVPIKNFL